MDTDEFLIQLERTIGRYGLLHHPFYEAWIIGALTRADLQRYAQDYFHHVESFPRAVGEFARRIPDRELKIDILRNLSDSLGGHNKFSHAELWLSFTEGVGVESSCLERGPSETMKRLTLFFHRVVTEGTLEEALAALYAYESQVPRISHAMLQALREKYCASERMCAYFEVRATRETHNAKVLRDYLTRRLCSKLTAIESAVASAEAASQALWDALTGIENACLENLVVASQRSGPAEGAD